MKRSFLPGLAAAALFAAVLSMGADAQIAGHSSTGATQTLAVTGAAQGLTVPQGTVWAAMCLEAANARWLDDGNTPTATVGNPFVAGLCMNFAGSFTAFRIIAQSGSPVLTVAYYR